MGILVTQYVLLLSLPVTFGMSDCHSKNCIIIYKYKKMSRLEIIKRHKHICLEIEWRTDFKC